MPATQFGDCLVDKQFKTKQINEGIFHLLLTLAKQP